MRSLLTLVVGTCMTIATIAQSKLPKAYRREFSITTENDAYLLQLKDAYYSNGILFKYAVADTTIQKKIRTVELGQSIFTPASRTATDPGGIDRPYCGWLFATYTQTTFQENKDVVLKWSLTAGVVGPASLAKNLQDGYHSLLRYKKFQGWAYQIRNAFGVDAGVFYARTLLKGGSFFKIVPINEASLGMNFTHISTGAVFCLGRFHQNNESALFNASITGSIKKGEPSTEFFLYTQPLLTLRVFNATVQGGLLTKGTGAVTAKPETWLYQQRTGICYAKNRVTTRIEYVYQSKETGTQTNAQQYGSISFAYRMF